MRPQRGNVKQRGEEAFATLYVSIVCIASQGQLFAHVPVIVPAHYDSRAKDALSGIVDAMLQIHLRGATDREEMVKKIVSDRSWVTAANQKAEQCFKPDQQVIRFELTDPGHLLVHDTVVQTLCNELA